MGFLFRALFHLVPQSYALGGSIQSLVPDSNFDRLCESRHYAGINALVTAGFSNQAFLAAPLLRGGSNAGYYAFHLRVDLGVDLVGVSVSRGLQTINPLVFSQSGMPLPGGR